MGLLQAGSKTLESRDLYQAGDACTRRCELVDMFVDPGDRAVTEFVRGGLIIHRNCFTTVDGCLGLIGGSNKLVEYRRSCQVPDIDAEIVALNIFLHH